jgi:hypothetical protein
MVQITISPVYQTNLAMSTLPRPSRKQKLKNSAHFAQKFARKTLTIQQNKLNTP